MNYQYFSNWDFCIFLYKGINICYIGLYFRVLLSSKETHKPLYLLFRNLEEKYNNTEIQKSKEMLQLMILGTLL